MKSRTRNLLILFATVGALLIVSASKAEESTGKCFAKEPRLVVTFISGDAESPVGGNEARGDFSILFTARAEGGRKYIPKAMRRETNFLIMRNQDRVNPYQFLVSASPTFDATPPSACDTPWEFCIGDGQARLFALGVTLEYPQESSYFGIRLRRLDVVGKVKYEPNIRTFATNSVFIHHEDFD